MEEIKKSVMLAFICNPYVAVLQKKTYLKYWKDEVDEVLVNVNGLNDTIRNFIADLWREDDKVTLIDNVPKEIRQGTAFDNLYPYVKGRVLITMDSDNFIYKKGVISQFSNLVLGGEYDAVGSIGYHAYPQEVAKACIDKYGTVRLNPFMSFWDKKIADKIEKPTFKTYNYKKGEHYAPIDFNMPEDGWMDIMAPFSLEFFNKGGSKWLKIPPTKEGSYTHIGAISSQYRRFFKSLENTNTQKYETATMKNQQMYYHAWHNLIYQYSKSGVPFPEFNQEYEKGRKEQYEIIGLESNAPFQTMDKLKNLHKNLFI